MSSSAANPGANVQIYIGRDKDEEFATNHFPLAKLDNDDLTDWAKNAVRGSSGTRLYFLL
jgi:hypothetical protein